MPHGDLQQDATAPQRMKWEMESGIGEWKNVPECVRETLLKILTSSVTNTSSSAAVAPADTCDTRLHTNNNNNTHNNNCHNPGMLLLPLRHKGPKTDISAALNSLYETQRPPAPFVPNLQSVVTELDEKWQRTSPLAKAATNTNTASTLMPAHGATEPTYKTMRTTSPLEEPQLLEDRRVFYGRRVESPPPSTSFRRVGHTQHSSSSSSPPVCRPLGLSPGTPVSRVVCSRQRVAAVDVLLRIHAAILRLCDMCDTSVLGGVYDAMRLDPRRAIEKYDTVRPAAHPSRSQEAALAAMAEAVAVLREASVELIAAALTPEEKRTRGVNSHKYQTRHERSTKYQYTTGDIPHTNSTTTTTTGASSSALGGRLKHTSTAATTRTSAHVKEEEEEEEEEEKEEEEAEVPVSVHKLLKENNRRRDHKPEETKKPTVSRPKTATDTATAASSAFNVNTVPEKSGNVEPAKPRPRPKPKSSAGTTNKAISFQPPQFQHSQQGQQQQQQQQRKQQQQKQHRPAESSLEAFTTFPRDPVSISKKKNVAPEPGTAGSAVPRPKVTKKSAATAAPSANLYRHLSQSTLSTGSADTAGNHSAEKKVERPSAPVPPTTSTISFGKFDIKRFKIDSDSDSEAM
ncbi:hypothetical protein LSM04_006080 [Trypanosoma melophagium]|uniref:uncharacterized protein n=1 Tax=Trypanosoma melophagium TaxID=715481 RepID=UPI00351AA54C|nr:hypothetical protein LSM04_006080 [Trypanosoma melophagium]